MGHAEAGPTIGQGHDPQVEERRVPGPGRVARERIAEAIQHHQSGDYGSAIEIYRWYHTHHPESARVLQLHGLASQQMGDMDSAIRLMSRSVALDPTDAPTRSGLGNLHYMQGNLEEALKCFALAIETDPGWADPYNDQGNVLRAIGASSDAVASYKKAIAIDATLAAPHFNLGNTLWDSGDVNGAIECYRTAIDIEPTNPAIHNNLGNAYRKTNDLAAAAQSYARAVSCDPAFTLARFNLATTYKDLGELAAALAAYRDVMALEPENALARHMVAALSGETSEAAPEAYVREVFDSYAGQFDKHLGSELRYHVPDTLREVLSRAAPGTDTSKGRRFEHALDLGCGTGLVAEAFRDLVNHFSGVDLSPRMLSEARAKGLYETLVEGELVRYLQQSSQDGIQFDAVLAADSFIYIGDLAPVFAGVADCLSPDGIFGFSIEVAETESYILRPTGRYAQSERYIQRLAVEHGFVVKAVAPTTIRFENGKPVEGAIIVLSSLATLARETSARSINH